MSNKIRFELLKRNTEDDSWTLYAETRTFEEADTISTEITEDETDRIQIHKVETTYVKTITFQNKWR